jgi:hypothetical protein
MNIEEYFSKAAEMAEIISNTCISLQNSYSGCTKCPFNNDSCLLEVRDFLKSIPTLDWLPADAIKKTDSKERAYIENVDRLAAEVCMLEEQNKAYRDHALENEILKKHLTQEVLANLEMRIALELNKVKLEDCKGE